MQHLTAYLTVWHANCTSFTRKGETGSSQPSRFYKQLKYPNVSNAKEDSGMRRAVLSAICFWGTLTIMAQGSMNSVLMKHMCHTFTTSTTYHMNIQEWLPITQLPAEASSATDIVISASELPDAVVYTLADRYPGGHISRIYADSSNGMKVYKVHIMLKDNTEVIVRIDERGSMI